MFVKYRQPQVSQRGNQRPLKIKYGEIYDENTC